MNPNHYHAVAIDYLYTHRPDWPDAVAVGKTAVSSSIIDRVVAGLGRRLVEVPVGFKWFVDGLVSGAIGIRVARSQPVRPSCVATVRVWTTDKDGIIMCLLASEILAVTGSTPSERYARTGRDVRRPGLRAGGCAGRPGSEGPAGQAVPRAGHRHRVGRRADHRQAHRRPWQTALRWAVSITTDNGWFAARPSGTEDVYKIYAESFLGPEHLAQVQEAAREVGQYSHSVSSVAGSTSEAKIALPPEVWSLIGANAIVALGYGLVAPVLPDLARHFGVSISAATFIITAFAVMRLLAAPPTGLLVQRLGSGESTSAGWRSSTSRLLPALSLTPTGSCWCSVRWRDRVDDVLRPALGLMIRISPHDARGRVAGLCRAFLVGPVAGPVLGQPDRRTGFAPRSSCGGVLLGRRRWWCWSDCASPRWPHPLTRTNWR